MTLATILALGFSASILQSPEVKSGAETFLGRSIMSDSLQQRRSAYQTALRDLIGAKRQKLKPFLVNVVRTDPVPKLGPTRQGPVDGQEETHSPRRIALSILAEWGDPDLIPLFLENIDYRAPDPNTFESTMGKVANYEYAAVKGLINIGKPAVDPCLLELLKCELPTGAVGRNDAEGSMRNFTRYNNLVYVLWFTLEYQEAQQYLAKEVTRLDRINPNDADKLRKASKYLEDHYRNKSTKP